MTLPRTLASYRPRHDADCWLYRCHYLGVCGLDVEADIHYRGTVDGHKYVSGPCSCGLDALLAAERALQPEAK